MKRIMIVACALLLFSCSKDDGGTTHPPTGKLPIMKTTRPYFIRLNSAQVGIYFESNANQASATSAGICYSTSPNPTIANTKLTIPTGGVHNYNFTVTGLANNTTYYVRAWATNSTGTGYGEQRTFRTLAPSTFTIGQAYQGGIIFFVDGSHGLIAYTSDIDNDIEWGCEGYLQTGTVSEIYNDEKGQEVGAGKSNTEAIVAGCTEYDCAARYCNDFVANGYDDWFLPSIDELRWLYEARSEVGVSFYDYWSSSESSNTTALSINFSQGYGYDINRAGGIKGLKYAVRPVRAF